MTARLGGVEIARDRQRAILEALDFTVADDWQVTCPSRRHDIEGAADLVEEVVRIHGLDHVASVALPRAEGVARPTATPLQLERKLRAAARAGSTRPSPGPSSPTARCRIFCRRGATLDARQSDQRGHEGHASVACSRPARCREAECRPRCRRIASVRARTALFPRQGRCQRRSPLLASCLRAIAPYAAGRMARRRDSMPSMPSRRPWRCSKRRAHRSTI